MITGQGRTSYDVHSASIVYTNELLGFKHVLYSLRERQKTVIFIIDYPFYADRIVIKNWAQ